METQIGRYIIKLSRVEKKMIQISQYISFKKNDKSMETFDIKIRKNSDISLIIRGMRRTCSHLHIKPFLRYLILF